MLKKYIEQLETLKENRAKNYDTNTDLANYYDDREIQKLAKFITDLKKEKQNVNSHV